MEQIRTRLNKYIAQHTEYSRRKADELIENGQVKVNGKPAQQGQSVTDSDEVTLDGRSIKNTKNTKIITAIMNKPVGFVCSREGQGSRTVYELVPENLKHLTYVGRLDKDSSGLLLLTNDGQLANQLTHPRYSKTKSYQVEIDKPLQPLHQQMISDFGITLEDGLSRLLIEKNDSSAKKLTVTMKEGRNRQVRRTFKALGYNVTKLHRTQFGQYSLNDLKEGQIKLT